jgi:hypothetical protein
MRITIAGLLVAGLIAAVPATASAGQYCPTPYTSGAFSGFNADNYLSNNEATWFAAAAVNGCAARYPGVGGFKSGGVWPGGRINSTAVDVLVLTTRNRVVGCRINYNVTYVAGRWYGAHNYKCWT